MKLFNLLLIGLITSILIACNVTTSVDVSYNLDITYLLSDSTKEASCVSFASDINNNPVISWIEVDSNDVTQFYFSKWENGFKTVLPIPLEENVNVHEEAMPKLAFDGSNTLFAFYETTLYIDSFPWEIGDVRCITSTDGGVTWSEPKSVFQGDGESATSFAYSGVATLPNGSIGITCLGTNPNEGEDGRPVLFTQSVRKDINPNSSYDLFLPAILIDKQACECCRTEIASDSDGLISIAFRSILPGSIRDISVSFSRDSGNTFSVPKKFSDDNWSIGGCPHNGPSVQVYKNTTHSAWYTGSFKTGVHYGQVDENGNMTNHRYISKDGRLAQVGILPNGEPIVVYNREFEANGKVFSQIIVTRFEEDNIYELALSPDNEYATYPVVRITNDNKILISWQDDTGGVCYRVITYDEIANRD